ncbi:MAG TPA: CpsB/CapC family capsule biosynthesis tyrosine phosphatase [Paenibacillus sp.]|nr:CpsB/CapC family capsule biosynthesis tyrosine phosphatase [Paenibacillus sp.]
MIDIHCHILHGVDDGAKDLETAVEMARIAAADGIQTVIATPHLGNYWKVYADIVRPKAAELQAELDRLSIPLRIRCGNELVIENGPFVEETLRNGQCCFLGDNPAFLLVEEPWAGFCPDTWDVLDMLRARGTTAVLAHPERHVFFREEPRLLDRMIETGAVWTQVSVDSLLGNNGPDAKAFAARLVERGQVHTLATDAHSITRRPVLAAGFDAVARLSGDAAADAIRERMATI